MIVWASARRGSPGLGVSSRAARRCSSDGGGRLDAVLREDRRASAKVDGSGTVGPEPITAGSSPGTSEIRRLTTLRRMRGRGQAPALDRREVLAHRVHLRDVGARGEQRAVDRLLVLEREAVRPAARAAPRRRRRSGTAPGRPRPRCSAYSRMRRAAARPAASGTGCAASTTSTLRARHRVAVAGHDQAFDRAAHVALDRARHRRRGFAGAEHDRAPGGRRGQMRREDRIRIAPPRSRHRAARKGSFEVRSTIPVRTRRRRSGRPIRSAGSRHHATGSRGLVKQGRDARSRGADRQLEPPGVDQMARQAPRPHRDQIEAQRVPGEVGAAQQEQLGGARGALRAGAGSARPEPARDRARALTSTNATRRPRRAIRSISPSGVRKRRATMR